MCQLDLPTVYADNILFFLMASILKLTLVRLIEQVLVLWITSRYFCQVLALIGFVVDDDGLWLPIDYPERLGPHLNLLSSGGVE